MKLRASEYISKAEGLKSSELSVRQKLESIKTQRSSVQSRIETLEYRLDSLYARMEALESSDLDDEDGSDNSAAIGAIMEEIAETQYEISEYQDEDAELRSQEMEASAELRQIEMEEQQTLSEIQDSAARENQNIALISAFGGDYSNVSAQVAGSFQQKLAQFSQAAQILGGTVAMGGGGSGGSVAGRLARGNLGESNGSSRNFYEAANSQRKAGANTGAMGAKGSGSSGGVRKAPDLYAGAAPSDEPPAKKAGGLGGKSTTRQEQNESINIDLSEKKESPVGDRKLADDFDYELSVGALLSKFRKKSSKADDISKVENYVSAKEKKDKFIQQLRVENIPQVKIPTGSNSSSDDDPPSIGERVKKHEEWLSDREQLSSNQSINPSTSTSDSRQGIENIKNRISSFLQKKTDNKKSGDSIDDIQKTIDRYCNNELNEVLSDSKKKIRIADTVEFQDDDIFASGFGDPKRAATVNGYNNGKKSYVKKSGPHPQKTAIHEHNHQLSCNDVRDKLGYIIERRRGISINGRDRQVNEAITEFFTKKMMGKDYPANPDVGYKYNMLRIEKMESGFGEDTLKNAFYQNKPRLLARKYEAIMGKGYSWADFSKAFDESLKEYTPEEIVARRDYFQKTGKRLVTETDIIRKKATDYANKCAALFEIRAKGVS